MGEAAPFSVEAFFEPTSDGGQRFHLLRTPGAAPGAAVLYVPPFAEEMNKSRRMASLQAQALATAGLAVLQIDLAGCGDSSGEFAQASWATWVDDIERGVLWLQRRFGVPTWLWGHRAGCLLAAQAATRLTTPPRFVFWQPVVSGATHLQQFLRLKTAAQMIDGQAGGKVEHLRDELKRGESIEVAGYELPAAVAMGLDAARLTPLGQATQVHWLEVAAGEDTTLPLASEANIAKWRDAGHDVQARVVSGPSFWRTTEIEDNSELLAATLAAVTSGRMGSI